EYRRELAERFGLDVTAASHLTGKFGTRAQAVLEFAKESPELSAPLVAGAAPLRCEVVHAVRNEMALTVEDVLARRIGLELFDWRVAMEAAPVTARLMGRELGWSATETLRAADRYLARMRRLLDAANPTRQPQDEAADDRALKR